MKKFFFVMLALMFAVGMVGNASAKSFENISANNQMIFLDDEYEEEEDDEVDEDDEEVEEEDDDGEDDGDDGEE